MHEPSFNESIWVLLSIHESGKRERCFLLCLGAASPRDANPGRKAASWELFGLVLELNYQIPPLGKSIRAICGAGSENIDGCSVAPTDATLPLDFFPAADCPFPMDWEARWVGLLQGQIVLGPWSALLKKQAQTLTNLAHPSLLCSLAG